MLSQYLSSYPYYSRDGQDLYLNQHVFKGMKHGTFIDIGAYDGIESSNTLFFEESLGWNGICVEPIVDAFNLLTKNRKCKCINKCVFNSNGMKKFIHVKPAIRPPSPRDPSRTSNYEKMSGLVESYPPEHKKIMYEIIEKYGGVINVFDCECVDVNDLLCGQKVDLLSMDTEGSELSILEHIDFSRCLIDTIVVEAIYNKDDILSLMANLRYSKLKEIGFDLIFKRMV